MQSQVILQPLMALTEHNGLYLLTFMTAMQAQSGKKSTFTIQHREITDITWKTDLVLGQFCYSLPPLSLFYCRKCFLQ